MYIVPIVFIDFGTHRLSAASLCASFYCILCAERSCWRDGLGDGEGAADAADQLGPRKPRGAARRRAARGGGSWRAARGVHVHHDAPEALPPAALPARPVRHRRPPPALRAQLARLHVHRSRCAHCSPLLSPLCLMFYFYCSLFTARFLFHWAVMAQ